MAPVILRLRETDGIESVVISTGQHRELLPQALGVFGLAADIDLDVMTAGQSPLQTTVRVLDGCAGAFLSWKPDVVLVHGDTTTTVAASLAAFYAKIPVGHVEAGLRTGQRYSPFPEEMNRLVADRIAELHFAPTAAARDNLLREGVDPSGVFVTGNTGIDALLRIAGPRRPRADGAPRLILVEAHRRENFGQPMCEIAESVRELARTRTDIEVLWSVHPNPEVDGPVRRILGGVPRVSLCEPPPYDAWARLLAEAYILLTDSGGLQEEAPALGVPVLVLRESTERPEAVACGAAVLCGSAPERILGDVRRLLDEPDRYRSMAEAGSPFGDGRAAERTVAALVHRFLGRGGRPTAFASGSVAGHEN